MDRPGGKLGHINPVLNVKDLDESVAFYTGTLGFEVLHTFGEPADFVILGRESHQIYLCHGGQGSPGTWLAFFVSDLAGMWTHLDAAGAPVVMPYEAGAGEFRVADPNGHVLRFLS